MQEQLLTQVLQQRLRFAKRTYPAQAAVLIAITQEEDPKILLTRRSAYLKNHAGEPVVLIADAEFDKDGGTSYEVIGEIPGRTDERIIY